MDDGEYAALLELRTQLDHDAGRRPAGRRRTA
jgi:hypothetical protein